MTKKTFKNWEELVNDGEQYGKPQGEFTPMEKAVIESIKDKAVLKIQDRYVFSKTGMGIAENHGEELARLLARFEPISDIRTLIITHNRLGPEGVRILVESPLLNRIEYLHLGSNGLGDEGVRHICQAEMFRNVHTLNLECNGITAEGAKALATSPVFTRVTSLNLVDNRIGDAGALALASSENLSTLTYLHLGGNRIKSEEAKRALRESSTLTQLKTIKIF